MKSFGTSKAELDFKYGRAKLVLPLLMTKKEVWALKKLVKYSVYEVSKK